MEIRKYYKDFIPEDAFEDDNEIEVTRFIFYLGNDMLVFADFSKDGNITAVNQSLEDNDTVKLVDNYSAPEERRLDIPYENIKMVESDKGLILNEEDFDLENLQQDNNG